jgi:hypothetical protein
MLMSHHYLLMMAIAILIVSILNVWSTHNHLMMMIESSSSSSSPAASSFFNDENNSKNDKNNNSKNDKNNDSVTSSQNMKAFISDLRIHHKNKNENENKNDESYDTTKKSSSSSQKLRATTNTQSKEKKERDEDKTHPSIVVVVATPTTNNANNNTSTLSTTTKGDDEKETEKEIISTSNVTIPKTVSTTITNPMIHINNSTTSIDNLTISTLSNMSSSTSSSLASLSSPNSDTTTKFVRYDNVAIATKIHGPHQWPLVVQSMCLLHFAYNNKVLYDIIIFTTIPIPNEDIDSLQKMLIGVNVNVVVDNKGLQEEISALTPIQYNNFIQRCNVTSPTNLTWFSECADDIGSSYSNRLAYNWQAEFRSIHLWHHPSLADYKYMMWLDTDGFCTKEWTNDPMEYFIKNEGVIMFDHFPQAKSKYWIQSRLYDGFNATICKLTLSEETGNFITELGDGDHCRERGVPNIHGFFHITSLDFYRSQPVKHGLQIMLGDCFLCRFPDDQLAVTAPAAILAPEKSWEMRGKGFKLDVFHNFLLDGIDGAKPNGFVKYWGAVAKYDMPSADGICPVTQRD